MKKNYIPPWHCMRIPMNRYYDLVLGLIPLALLGVSALLHVAGFSLTTAVPMGGFVSAGIIGHAMFVRGPVAEMAEPEPQPFESAD